MIVGIAKKPTKLVWSFSVGADTSQVDYIEVVERQPEGREAGDYDGYIHSKEVKFYIENNKSLSPTSLRTINLLRSVRGVYNFDIRACKRIRKAMDICSDYINEIIPEITAGRPQGTEADFQIVSGGGLGSNRLIPKQVENVQWYEFNGSYAIEWQENTSGRRANYFYITQESTTNGATHSCLFGSTGTISSSLTAKIKINFVDMIASGTNTTNPKWSSETHCENMGAGTSWGIKACTNGQGCSAKVIIDMTTTPPASHNSLLQSTTTITPPTTGTPPSIDTSDPTGSGDPGDFLPGMWWNPELAGTGWHFYWASELRMPAGVFGHQHGLKLALNN